MSITPPTEEHNIVKSPACTPSLMGLVTCVVLSLAVLLGSASPAWAQLTPPIGVESLITVEVPAIPVNIPAANYTVPCNISDFPGCNAPGATTNLTFGAGVNRALEAVIVAGNRFEPAGDLLPPDGLPEQVVFRRNGTPARELLFFEDDGNPTPTELNLLPDVAAGIEAAMLSRFINRGIDNVFDNEPETGPAGTGDETSNNIQRIDYIVTGSGIQVPLSQQNDVGFLILERNGNDAFGIAAITALDGAGNPAAYGPLISVPTTAWGSSTEVSFPSAVLRRDNLAVPGFLPSHLVPVQTIQGILFPISSLVQAPQNASPIFGYSLFATDVGPGDNLVDFTTFPTDTSGDNGVGGLDLVAGGFGLIRLVPPDLALTKRITGLTGPANLPDFSQVEGTGAAIALLQSRSLGQGLTTITDPTVASGNQVEYTIYFSNTGAGDLSGLTICDQIPAGLSFATDGFAPGQGIQAIASTSSNPAGPTVSYTNDAGDDPGTFFPAGAALPAVCGTDQGNGAVVVDVGTVGSNQVGLVRFRATVN